MDTKTHAILTVAIIIAGILALHANNYFSGV